MAVFGGAYAALYARFSSQWAYLAGTYNDIKAAQARKDANQNAIAEWRAAFIEDCDDLHLLRKSMFASAVDAMLNRNDDEALLVQKMFDEFSPGGARRRQRIATEARHAVAEYEYKAT
jgi:hypothetical protein